MAWELRKMISDDEYVARVRRHRPSALLPLIAQTSARFHTGAWGKHSSTLKFNPWALADAARVSLAYGNEYRHDATHQDLERILWLYSQLDDHLLRDEADLDSLERYLLRTSGEQLTLQESPYDNLARTAAVITHTSAAREPRCLRPGWEEDLFGTSLSTYVGIARLLWAATLNAAGRFNPIWLEAPDMAPIHAVISVPDLTTVVEDHFVTDVDGFKLENKERRLTSDSLRRRFEYNPLRGRPFLRGYGPGYLAPVTDLVWHKGSPLGIFYTGVARYGSAFAQDIGELFEAYVGRQLALWPNATVIPEITYGRTKKASVDWIVVTDELVLLVEVKSTRPTQHLRLATDKRVEEVQRMLGHAYDQIDNTASLIKRQQKEFASIPSDLPLQGLIVTMEPFHTANGPSQRAHLPQTSIPVSVCSAGDLEHMVTIDDASLGQLLIERADDPQRFTYGLREALTGHSRRPNSLLEAGWKSYPWHPSATRSKP
ncbi:hypothetical protein ACFY5F_29510 [Streptomyces sp. NPDC013161]|uniref:hypothetical protein n=1 Tax=Streptomyces sp. NPDC013161 TaxID=3364862 RepID=UPI0036CBCE0C